MPNPTPAETLAAVLRVLLPNNQIEPGAYWDGRSGVYIVDYPAAPHWEMMLVDDRNSYAEIVAMLSPEQRGRFNHHYAMAHGGDRGLCPLPAGIIIVPATDWLDALVAATGARVE